ncbi:MAG: histidine phosphatase family protein [Deinococcales bacterium]
MSYLFLIRHAKTQPDPQRQAKDWRLVEGAELACQDLAKKLATKGVSRIISSKEHKAERTAEMIAKYLKLSSMSVEGLHEQDRSQAPFLSEELFQMNMKQGFENPNRLIWGVETMNQALDRFEHKVTQLLKQYPSEKLAIVSHGTVMSLFVAKFNYVDPYSLWRKLKMPDMLELSLPYFQLSASAQMFG